MKFICLLLKSSKKRTEHVNSHLKKHIPNLEIFYAVEGKTNELEYRLNNRTINENLTNFCRRGQIACLLSHIEIWKKMLNENIEECVIIEDDSIVSENFTTKFDQIYDLLPKESEFLYLYVHPDCKKESEEKILTPGYFTYGTVAYYIKKSLAKEFITFFENHIFNNVDDSIAWYLNYHKKIYFCVTENLVETGGTLYFQRKDETRLLGSEIGETHTFKNSKAIISFFIDDGEYICFPCCRIKEGYLDSNFNEIESKKKYLEDEKIVGFNSNGIIIQNLNNQIEIDTKNNLYIKKSYLSTNK